MLIQQHTEPCWDKMMSETCLLGSSRRDKVKTRRKSLWEAVGSTLTGIYMEFWGGSPGPAGLGRRWPLGWRWPPELLLEAEIMITQVKRKEQGISNSGKGQEEREGMPLCPGANPPFSYPEHPDPRPYIRKCPETRHDVLVTTAQVTVAGIQGPMFRCRYRCFWRFLAPTGRGMWSAR